MIRRLLAAFVLLLAAATAGAQTLDDIDVRTQGEQKVVRVRFNASVSFITIAPAGAADQYLLRFELLAGDDVNVAYAFAIRALSLPLLSGRATVRLEPG